MIGSRFYETVTVEEHSGQQSFDMPAHVSQMSAEDRDDPTMPYSTISIMRMVFPPEFSLHTEQKVTYRGQQWRAYVGEQIHTRRGKLSHKSADLKRVT